MKNNLNQVWPVLLILLALTACQKDLEVLPAVPIKSTATVTAKPDTIPDSAMLKIILIKDSVNTDETMFVFNHTYKLTYSFNQDAPYFAGFGQVSLASISSDGRDLAINELPYSSGMSIGLDVHMQSSGAYSLGVSYKRNIPSTIGIWIKDAYLKDSVNVASGSYRFNVLKTDSNSWGNKRFKLILKSK